MSAPLTEREKRMLRALRTIVEWKCPSVWSEEDHKWHSYSSEYGSNGERDYMREIAAKAIAEAEAADEA